MYCYYCGKKIDEKKIEKSSSSRQKYIEEAPLDASIQYVCPRCGHLIHEGFDEKDSKSLSAACHAELQRGRNDFARGMSALSIAIILGVVSFIFFLLSKKADNGYQIVWDKLPPEFYVFAVLALISVILLVYGGIFTGRGIFRNQRYTKLLKDINTKTFVQ